MNMTGKVDLVECPRDAMQGWERIIPTEDKIRYGNALMQAGFHTLDIGSFVSAKAIPQMADTPQVLQAIDRGVSRSRVLVIVANARGAEAAASVGVVDDMGYPFSVSPTFQHLNANSTILESLDRLKAIHRIAMDAGKQTVAYLSMAFGNPYGDAYAESEVLDWAFKLRDIGIRTISLADTVGLATPDQVSRLTGMLVTALPDLCIGVHLHALPEGRKEKVDAAWDAGARRFDGALLGLGGCPMSGNALVGNMDMAWMAAYFAEKGADTGVDPDALARCSVMARSIFQPDGSAH